VAGRSDASGGEAELELLERHRPLLRYDRQYDYRVAAAVGAVENPGNLLRRFDGEVIARAGAEPSLSLELLTAYPEGLSPRDDDCLSFAPDVLGDARRMEGEERYAGRLYGRVLEEDGRTWLQYWFWLYYNPKNLFGFGKHEGDWEMIQLGLGADGEPELATYAQHDSGEARQVRADKVEFVERGGRRHPVVYVSPYSHASYFGPGTHPYVLGIDHPYGDGPEALLPVEPFGDWARWPGRWGNSERVIARRIGNGPPSPGHQGSKWRSAAAFHRATKRRRLRASMGRLLHFVGRGTYPRPPEVRLRIEGRRAVVDYRLVQERWRRSRHVYLTVHDGERVIASRAVRGARQSDSEMLLLPRVPERPELWASSFNRLRQRSELAHAESERTAPPS
jgi:hypothetical protein